MSACAGTVTAPTLVFMHGWGFDHSVWRDLRHRLEAWPQCLLERGYFAGSIRDESLPAGPLVVIGHSFGYLHMLDRLASQPSAQPCAWVSINGFARFAAGPGFPMGVNPRILRRMLARLAVSPEAVADEFRRRCGVAPAGGASHAGRLAQDLQTMMTLDARDAQPGGPGDQPGAPPLLVLAGTADGVVPEALTRSTWPGNGVEWLPGGGHLLPLEAADWCAARIAAFLGNHGLAPDSAPGRAPSYAVQGRYASGAHPDRPADVAARFSAAAVSYEGHASVQHGIAARLAEQIAALDLPRRPRILEIGCGTGALTRRLGAQFADADWTITDLSPAMVRTARRTLTLAGVSRYRVMDGEAPDLDEGSARFDLICSSMAVQWFGDPVQGLDRLAALLAPGGHLAVALPVHGTFAEWQSAHERLGLRARTLRFLEPAALRPRHDSVQARIEVECVTNECGSARAFLSGLRRVGATAAQPGTWPLSAAQLRRVCTEFERAGARCSYRIAYCLWSRPEAALRGGIHLNPPVATRPTCSGVFVTGTDTDVGKTLVAAILARAWGADYWKPYQTGIATLPDDTETVAKLIGSCRGNRLHPPACVLRAPLAPWAAARAQGITLQMGALRVPDTTAPLVVEGAGGLYVPVDEQNMMIDLAVRLGLPVVLVTRSTLGTINHTLLSLHALRERNLVVLGVVMNGPPSPGNREALEHFGRIPVIAEIPPLPIVDAAAVAAMAAGIPPLACLMQAISPPPERPGPPPAGGVSGLALSGQACEAPAASEGNLGDFGGCV